MSNNPQSSRRAKSQGLKPFMNIPISSKTIFKGQDGYTATSLQTAQGTADIQIKKKENANPLHYLLIIGAIVGAVYMFDKKAEEIL